MQINQVVIRDKTFDMTVGGIRLPSGDVVCGHCGTLIKKSEFGQNGNFEILEVFETWIDLSPLICLTSKDYQDYKERA